MSDEPLSITEIIEKVGIDNIQVQSIHQSLRELSLIDTNQTMIVSFYSAPADLMKIRSGERIGLVVWFDRERIDYSDTPPEMGMAGDYEDHDAETAEVLKHIVGE
jgi:hypothetical protein